MRSWDIRKCEIAQNAHNIYVVTQWVLEEGEVKDALFVNKLASFVFNKDKYNNKEWLIIQR